MIPYPASMWDGLFMLVRIALLVYVGLLVMLAGCQRKLLYYPIRTTPDNALSLAASRGLVPWQNATGTLIGWHTPDPDSDRDALLFFHGNAGFAAQRSYLADGLRTAFDVYIMEYPGYGARAGSPSESAFYDAAEQAWAQLRAERNGRLFLGGESLGTGVAAYIAGQHPSSIAGLLLITPFTSLVDVARSHYPVFPVGLLMRDRYPSVDHLKTYSGPLAVILAEHDEVVPTRFGEQLFREYDGEHKRKWIHSQRTHNSLDYTPTSPWWREVITFLDAHAP